MKRKFNVCLVLLCSLFLVVGCSDNKESKAKPKSDEKTYTDEGMGKNSPKNEIGTSTVSDVIEYFDNQGIKYSNMKNHMPEDLPFKDGRMFDVNGKKVYMYDVDSKDTTMNDLLTKAKNDGSVKVKVDGVEKSYMAAVNGTKMMIYETEEGIKDVIDSFMNFK